MQKENAVEKQELSPSEIQDRKAEELREKQGSFLGLTFKYGKKYWIRSLIILGSILIASLSVAVSPLITQELMKVAISVINDGPNTGKWHMTWQHLVYLSIGMIAINAVFTFAAQYFAGMLGKQMEIDLRNETLEKLIEEDMSYYSNKKIGEILTKVVSDTQIIGDQAAIIPITFLNSLVTFFVSLIMMFVIDWKLTLVSLGVFVIIVGGMTLSFMPLKNKMTKLRRTVTQLNGDVIDRINTVKLIKSSGTETYEAKRFVQLHKKYYNEYYDLNLVQALLITFLFVGINSVQVVVVVAAALIYKNDTTLLANLLPTFIISVGILIGPIMQMIRVLVGMIQASTGARRIHSILTAPVRFNNRYRTQDGVNIDDLTGNIVFKDVEFEYPEKPGKVVFPRFNFTFEKGKSYAFVGETGSGKSTVSKLLLRFYDPSKGAILINDEIDLRDANLSSYLQHVGYVEQEPAIFLGNVFDNIRYAKFDATDEEIIAAAKKANLHKVVMSWAEGYETILGERGFMLSGGQKQRLVIARIFLKNPELLILDEATSALDNIVEKEIQKELDKLMKGRTSITIAHRLSTIKNVDLIMVLEPGKGVVQTGTFAELIQTPGRFKALYEAGKTEE